jgi:GntR family transcriptional regulator
VINPRGGPKFQQLAAMLRDDIRAGRIQPGHLLPSETVLQQRHDVNRLTARAAINVLRAEGLAELVFGRGVIVREPNELQDLVLPADSVAVSRMPTVEERAEYGIPEGVPLISVTAADGAVEVYPADRWQLRGPRTHWDPSGRDVHPSCIQP